MMFNEMIEHGALWGVNSAVWIIMCIGAIILIVIGVAYLVKWVFNTPYQVSSTVRNSREKEKMLDILTRRYTSGEINRDEFKQMKKDLGIEEEQNEKDK